MSFTQIIEVDGVADGGALEELMAGWDADQRGVAPGYLGARLLADRDASGRFLIEVDFSSAEEARRNDGREATSTWAERLRKLADGTPSYRNLEPVYATRG